MAQKNVIALAFSEEDMAEIQGAIEVLQRKLMPRLVSLSAQDRQELPKMGDKTVAFVQKAYEYGQRNRELAPAWLDLEAMGVDLAAVGALREISRELAPIYDALNDSLLLSGSEAYQGALLFYSGVKAAAKAKASGAISICDDLSARFPGAGAGKRKTV